MQKKEITMGKNFKDFSISKPFNYRDNIRIESAFHDNNPCCPILRFCLPAVNSRTNGDNLTYTGI